MEIILGIEGMQCDACARSVDKVLRSVNKVTNVKVDLQGRSAQITHEGADLERLVSAVDEAGFEAALRSDDQAS